MKRLAFITANIVCLWIALCSFTVNSYYTSPDGDELYLYKNGSFLMKAQGQVYRGTYDITNTNHSYPVRGEVGRIRFTIDDETEVFNWYWPLQERETVDIGAIYFEKVRDL